MGVDMDCGFAVATTSGATLSQRLARAMSNSPRAIAAVAGPDKTRSCEPTQSFAVRV